MRCIWKLVAATESEKAALQAIPKWSHPSREQCSAMNIAMVASALLQLSTFLTNCFYVDWVFGLYGFDLFICFVVAQCFFMSYIFASIYDLQYAQ